MMTICIVCIILYIYMYIKVNWIFGNWDIRNKANIEQKQSDNVNNKNEPTQIQQSFEKYIKHLRAETTDYYICLGIYNG